MLCLMEEANDPESCDQNVTRPAGLRLKVNEFLWIKEARMRAETARRLVPANMEVQFHQLLAWPGSGLAMWLSEK